jgi:hypothetical protein
MTKKKTFKVKVSVTYDLYLLAEEEDSNKAVDSAEQQLKEHDDYMVVNRASSKSMKILDIIEVLGQEQKPKPKKKR